MVATYRWWLTQTAAHANDRYYRLQTNTFEEWPVQIITQGSKGGVPETFISVVKEHKISGRRSSEANRSEATYT